MNIARIYTLTLTGIIFVTLSSAGISPIHDFKQKNNDNYFENRLFSSPHRVLNHLDNTIRKTTQNVTHNPKMEETLYQISKDLVSAILTKLEIQDKITRITKEALEAPGKSKGMTAIETRRILDYISRTLSGHMLSITKMSTEPELHRLVYGLAQIAAEISIVSALKDITYATTLYKRQAIDFNLRKKRSINATDNNTLFVKPITENVRTVYNAILNKTSLNPTVPKLVNDTNTTKIPVDSRFISPFSVVPNNIRSSVMVVHNESPKQPLIKGFLNQTALDSENGVPNLNETDSIVLDKEIAGTHDVVAEPHTLDTQESSAPGLLDDWLDPKDNNFDADEDELERNLEDELVNSKKTKQRLEKIELKAKKAILHAGDVAYLTAASVVAMRRALTASIEVKMSVKYAKSGMSNHRELMMNLARTAAQQAGKEARIATSKSLACERVIKLALKYTAQSQGANLNHVASRVIMDSLSLSTLAKSMAFVASDIAINSLYKVTDVKTPI